jgi:hypothetical protein
MAADWPDRHGGVGSTVAEFGFRAAGCNIKGNISLSGERIYPRIPQMARVDRPRGPRNAGETADSFFHPSRPSGFGHLAHRKSLISQAKLVHGAGRTPIHLGNPGLTAFFPLPGPALPLPIGDKGGGRNRPSYHRIERNKGNTCWTKRQGEIG